VEKFNPDESWFWCYRQVILHANLGAPKRSASSRNTVPTTSLGAGAGNRISLSHHEPGNTRSNNEVPAQSDNPVDGATSSSSQAIADNVPEAAPEIP